MTNVTVVVGAQFGSEGKGAIAGHLGKSMGVDDVAIRVAGPNAGHTVYDSKGRCFKLRCIPVAAVTSKTCQLHIAAGSEIDPEVLTKELYDLESAGHDVGTRLTIHPSATIIEPGHLNAEKVAGLTDRIGSTAKGIGAARAARIMRTATTWDVFAEAATLAHLTSEPGAFNLDDVHDVVIEGTQGYGLGLHTPYYPHVTSSDCRAIDFLAMSGISPWSNSIGRFDLRVILVARMYPIRVAGNSGPLRHETTWEALGLPEEHTTVTGKVRRVGAWDEDLVIEAIDANGGGGFNDNVVLALTMLDQRYPSLAGKTDLGNEPLKVIDEMETGLECTIAYVGTGPRTVVEL